MAHPFGDDEPLTIARVKYRLNVLIEVMPINTKDVHNDQLLANVRDDLIRIARAIEWLERNGKV